MKNIEEIVEYLEKECNFSKKNIYKGKEFQMNFKCLLYKQRENFYIQSDIPNDLKKFWQLVNKAILFLDTDYGQWGLKIFSLTESLRESSLEKENRPKDYINSDLVIGEFIGDSDKLVVDCSQANFGKILVSLPIDSRKDLYVVASSFKEFLNLYIDGQGEKFWE